jgi:hypothetical protein
MISCEKAARLSSESHDRSLTLSEQVSLRFHLVGCKLCSRYARQLKFLRSACAHIEDGPAGNVQLSDDARDRIRQRLKQR